MPRINAPSQPDGGSTTYSFSHPIDLDIYMKLRISAVGFGNAVMGASDASLMKVLGDGQRGMIAIAERYSPPQLPFIRERNILISRKLRIE